MNLKTVIYGDMRPSTANFHRDKIQVGIYNELHKLGNTFSTSKVTSRVEFYTKQLVEADYTLNEVSKAVDHCMTHCKFFPAYSEIINILSNISTKQQEKKEANNKVDQEKINNLLKNTEKLKKMFISKYGEDQLNEWLSRYCNEVFPRANFDKYGLSVQLFLPVFLQDLVKGKDLDGAIKEGKEKTNRKAD